MIFNKTVSIIRFSLLLLVGVCVLSCSGGEDDKKKKDAISDNNRKSSQAIQFSYDNWEKYQFQLIDIIYPADHPQKANIEDMAAVYWSTVINDCRLLKIPVPQKRLTVCFYTGPGLGKEITGQVWPFTSSDTIHQWPPIQLGLTVMEYILPYWSNEESDYPFVKNGLMKLMDAAGRNYHQYLFDYIDSNKYIPLSELAVYPIFNPKGERYQSALAASFVDFIIFQYGIEKLKKLYLSKEPFDKTVINLFGISVDALEIKWHTVARQAAAK